MGEERERVADCDWMKREGGSADMEAAFLTEFALSFISLAALLDDASTERLELRYNFLGSV